MTSDEDAQAFVAASRALVGIAARSILASPIDITVSQQRFLVLLATEGPLSLSQIAAALDIDLSGVSRICDRLQRNFLVKRERDEADRRVIMVSITYAGMDLLTAIDDIRREEVKRVLEGMSPGEVAEAVRVLKAFAAHAGETQRRWGWGGPSE